MRRFLDTIDDPWMKKYNLLIEQAEAGKTFKGKLTLHHIIPRSVAPELANDKENWIWLPFKEHIDMHYWLWKHSKKFASQLWFGCVYGRKHGLWDLPGGEEEYEQLKQDLKLCRRLKSLSKLKELEGNERR